jgi:hypothetical protein
VNGGDHFRPTPTRRPQRRAPPNRRATTATPSSCRSPRSPGGWAAPKRRSRPTCGTPPAKGRAPSSSATRAPAAAAAHRPPRATARATPTPTARTATPAPSKLSGPASGCATRCSPGARTTAGCRPPMTGHAPTPGDAAARHSPAWPTATGHRRRPSPTCTAAGRPHTPTRLGPTAHGGRTWLASSGRASIRRRPKPARSASSTATIAHRPDAVPARR